MTDLKLHSKKYISLKIVHSRVEQTTSVSCSANWASKESVGHEISEVNFVVSCTTSHLRLFSFLESIEYDFIKALMIHTDNQIVT